MQAILDYEKGNMKMSIVKEMIKKDADFSIQNLRGNNALHICASQGNSDVLGMIVLKMMNDELNNKLIGKILLNSQAVFKLVNQQNDDALIEAIRAKSKECISILLDVGNMKILKIHVTEAKNYINGSSKIYSLIVKRFHYQEGKVKLIIQ